MIKDVSNIIAEYSATYELLDWIDIDNIDWYMLSGNPNAMHLIEKNLDKVDWYWLSGNPNTAHDQQQQKNYCFRCHWRHRPGYCQ